MILLHLLIIIMYMDGWHGVRMNKLPSQCTRGMIHRVDMPRCTGAGPGGASIVQAAASHDIVHGWMARCVHGCQCIQHAHGPVQIAWGMHQCTMSGSIHPSIMHGWIHLCIRPCMMREREAVWTLPFLMAFSPTPAYSAPISMYTRHDPSCGHAKMHGGGAWGCQHCTSRSIP